MEWRRSGARSVMQIAADPTQPYFMDVVWYVAPAGAKRYPGINAFTSGVWDRDTPALPPDLGEQPPYNSPYYGGRNVWGYLGQCFVGRPEQFELGVSQSEIAHPPTAFPLCCAGNSGENGDIGPGGPIYFGCSQKALGAYNQYTVQLFNYVGPPVLGPIFYEPFLVTIFNGCEWRSEQFFDGTYTGTFFLDLSATATNLRLFVTYTGSGEIFWFGGTINDDPIIIPATGGVGPPAFFIPDSYVIISPFPGDQPLQPIVLSGDVIGTGYPLIPCTLVNVIVAGIAGDATHVPQITWDAKGRILSVTAVAIAGGSLAYGDAISGSTPFQVLFADGSGNLFGSSSMQFNGGTFLLNANMQVNAPGGSEAALFFGSPSFFAHMATTTEAANFSDGTHTVLICDGANNITYSPGTPGDWSGTPPTDVWIALDRLAAYLNTVGGGPVP